MLNRKKINKSNLSNIYDKIHAIKSDAYFKAKQFIPLVGASKLINEYILYKDGNIIDVGCGRAELLINSYKNNYLNVGIDFSYEFLKDAVYFKNKFIKYDINKLYFILHDLNNSLPIKDNIFDIAVSIACLEHVFDVYGLMKEINRILKLNGLFYLVVPNIAYIKHRLRLLFGLQPVTASKMDLWWREFWDGTHIHYFTFNSLKMLLKQNGFKIFNITGSGKYRFLRKWWPTLLCGDLIVSAQKINNIKI